MRRVSTSAVVFAEAGAAEPTGRLWSQKSMRVVMAMCIAEVDSVKRIEKPLLVAVTPNKTVS